MNKYTAKLVGVSPLMMHNERLANPLDETTRELKKLTAQKGGKSDELLEQIMRLEWRGGLYLDDDGAVAMPSDNVVACLKGGARKRKKGKDFAAGVVALETHYRLEYPGPKSVEALWDNRKFLDYRGVVVSNRRIMRARPIFRQWSLQVELHYDADIVNGEDLQEALIIAGERVGLCERRPDKGGNFGRFIVEAA